MSVVITCFNYANYVGQAIRSALDQHEAPLEVIVVNDGSTDGSAAVLAGFGDRIQVVHQPNSGQIVATNRGYARSRGQVVMFLDADDVLLPGAIGAVRRAWTPQCAKVQFELDVIDGSGRLLGRRFCNYVDGYGAAEIRAEFAAFGTYVWPVLSGNAYARWYLEQLMPLTVQRAPDGHLNTLAPLYGPIEVIRQPYALYRLHDANQSYHGTASSAIGTRFAKQISLRLGELRTLSAHAVERSVPLPPGPLIDNDLPFVNYRLMLQKLRCDYEGAASDSSWRLWRAGMALLQRRPLPARLKLAHATWLSVLACSPQVLAERLIALRFNRAALLQSAKRSVGSAAAHAGASAQTLPLSKPAILVISYISPLQRWGSAKRSRLLVEALQRHGHVDMLVLSFVKAAGPGEAMTVTDMGGARVLDLQVVERGLRGRPRFDLVSGHVSDCVAEHVDLAAYDLLVSRYVRPAMKLHLPADVPLIVDFDDALYEPPWHALRTPKHWVGVALRLINDKVITRGRLRGAEWRRARYFFCREQERCLFPWLPGAVLPNLAPKPERPGPPDFSAPAEPTLMFIGLLDYMPNHDAVDWFLAEIWPRVLRAVPEARFLVVGDGAPERLARWREWPRVETPGFVESLTQAYAQATACVVPMRSGGGTNIKALEPYLYGRMIIATPLVVDGHQPLFNAGRDVLVAADAEGFARHCIAMLRAPNEASAMARRGYERITQTLTEERFRAVVDAAVAVVRRPVAARGPAQPQIPSTRER